jgi:hypothetical protein
MSFHIASIYVKIETGDLVSSQWKKYIKYYVYHVTDLANEIVRKNFIKFLNFQQI